MLPIKSYALVAKAFHKKGVTATALQQQLKESRGVISLNGNKISVSQSKLVSELAKLEAPIQRQRVSIVGVRPAVLEQEYARLLAENKYI